MRLDQETKELVDSILDYVHEREQPLDAVFKKLHGLAKQRLPEREVERTRTEKQFTVEQQIVHSQKLTLVIRVPMRSRIHEVHWEYFPDYHVIASTAYEKFAFPVRLAIEDWGDPVAADDTIYMDDVFYDPDARSFWQPEPFLVGLTPSARAFRHMQSKGLEYLDGTSWKRFKKVNPALITPMVEARRGVADYAIKKADEFISRHRPLGSRGWRQRMKGVWRQWSKGPSARWR